MTFQTEPWTTQVTIRDARWSGDQKRCYMCDGLIGEEHRRLDCSRLASRRRGRISFIAYLHTKGRHPLTDDHVAARLLEHRDMLIDEIQPNEADREVFRAAAQRFAREVDDAAQHRQQFLHLDRGWDGEGLRPSLQAALVDSVRSAFS